MMRKQTLLVSMCLIGLVIGSCNSQRASTPEAVPITTLVPTSVASHVVLYRGNPQRTGLYDFPAIRQKPNIKWQNKISSTWLMPPLVMDGILYTGAGDGILYALNAETGEQIWSVGGFGQLESTGAVAGDVIVTGGYSQLVKALNRKTGDEVWSFKTDYYVQGAPLIVNDRVYVATDRMVYSLDLKSGKLIWKVPTGTQNAFMGPPAYDKGVIYTTGENSCLPSMQNPERSSGIPKNRMHSLAWRLPIK